MRHALYTAALLLALSSPAFAAGKPAAAVASQPDLPIHLATTSTPAPWFTSGVVAGRLGGVPVVGSYTGTTAIGLLTLTVHRATFAYGGYTCVRRACTFTGTLAGIRVKAFPLPLNIRGAATAVAGAFPTRRSWIGAVTNWARQHLTRDQQRHVVAETTQVLGS